MRYSKLIKELQLRISTRITYHETKQEARNYQDAKRELFKAFEREDLGIWLEKEILMDNFSLAT